MTPDQLLAGWMILTGILMIGLFIGCSDRSPLGRLNRRWFFATFWGGALVAGLAWRGLNAIATSGLEAAVAWTAAVPLLLVCLGGLALWVWSPLLRIHDLGLAGWYYFVFAIPIVQFLFMAALFLWPGEKGPNRFGERNRYVRRQPVRHEPVAAL